jgi:hypothetical protein
MPIYLIVLELLLQGFSVLHACDFFVSVKSQMFLLISCRMTRGSVIGRVGVPMEVKQTSRYIGFCEWICDAFFLPFSPF